MENIEKEIPQADSEINLEKLEALRENLLRIAQLGPDADKARSLILAFETAPTPGLESKLRETIEALNEKLKDIPDSLEL
jgi:hypothetical protein